MTKNFKEIGNLTKDYLTDFIKNIPTYDLLILFRTTREEFVTIFMNEIIERVGDNE